MRDWRQTRILVARPIAFHCVQLLFTFDNVDLCEHMTGGGEAARVLAGKVSQAWINFVRSGNLVHPRIPHWQRYEPSTKTTMAFDDTCEAEDNLDSSQLDLIETLST